MRGYRREKSKCGKILIFGIWEKEVQKFLVYVCHLVAQMVRICLQCGRPWFDPGSGRSPGEETGNLLQYSCLENPMESLAGYI